MKLETKLNLSTGVLVFALFVSASSTHLRLSNIMKLARVVDGQRQPYILAMETMRGHLSDGIVALESSILTAPGGQDQSFARGVSGEVRRQAGAEMAALVSGGQALDRGPAAEDLNELASKVGELQRLEEEAEAQSDREPGTSMATRAILTQRILPLKASIDDETVSMLRAQRSLTDAEELSLRNSDAAVIWTLWTISLLGAAIGGFVSFVLGRRITGAIERVAARAASIAEGDLTGTELELGANDQIGKLAEAMNKMQMSLGGIIGTVADTAGSLTGSALSMRSASDQIHRRIDQQSQQTQQAATAMQEMSASIAEVSRHTHSAAETARAAAQTARDGGTIVKEMLASMHSIALAVTETSSTVGLLGGDSRRISQIVTVIDEIARKTNLLALNAAIEAARAGEQGRGFAVVAGEVRRLAESTAQATGEIGTMIGEIQDRTRTAIASMASGTGTVEQGVVTTTQAGEALERIIGMAERVDRMITQIAIAAQQQATAADKSSASLDSIHTLSHENLSEMSTTAAGIENLRGTAVTLEKQVDRFQIQAHPQYREARAA